MAGDEQKEGKKRSPVTDCFSFQESYESRMFDFRLSEIRADHSIDFLHPKLPNLHVP
jgi:hypothetical protein